MRVDDRGRDVEGGFTEQEAVHCWRPRRSGFGELVQWDTSEHDWLEGRGPVRYLVRMIDDGSILSHSPQAKGRVERGFRTAQDRLVKQLRLAQVSTLEAANAFL